MTTPQQAAADGAADASAMTAEQALNRALDEAIETGILRSNPISQVYFRAGLLAARETIARFVEESGSTSVAAIRANWWPALGEDPGPPRKYEWDELVEERPEGGWRTKPVSASVEALAIAQQFLEAVRAGGITPTDEFAQDGWMQVRIGDFVCIRQEGR